MLVITYADILMSVRYHTTRRAGMCLLEKIVFLADLISADRHYPDVERMRGLAFESLDGSIRYAAGFLIQDLIQKGRLIHPDTVGAYNDTFPTESEQKELRDGTT
ncbi:MAG: hypothetical protein LIO46_04840 [Clostridiales bacterium]|nr:hypothetical protein [Clostridiales bacterium]